MEKDSEVNENQTQRRSELKNPISLTQQDQDNQTNPNTDLIHISPQHNISHKLSTPHPQQHSASPSLEETLAILRTISPGDPQGYKERESEPKQLKLQQYAGLMGVIERFHEIMKPIIEEEKKKPQVMLPGQNKHYPNKDGPLFFYPPKNYRPTLIPRPKVRNLSEEQWEQFDGDVRQGVVPYLAGFINIHPQIYQSIHEAVIGLITFAAEQIVETEREDKEQLIRELERIVADGTDDNGDNDQSEHAIEPKHFTNGNDGLRQNDNGTQLQATVNGEANPEINITKTSANTPPHNVNGQDGLGGNGFGTRLQAATNDNGHENHQAIDNTGNEDSNKQNQETQTLHNPKANLLQSKHLQNQVKQKERMQYLNRRLNKLMNTILEAKQVNQSPYLTNPQGVPKLEPTLTLLATSHPSRSREKRHMQPQLLQTSPLNTPKTTRPVQNPRNRNKDSTPTTKQKQNPIPRLTNRINWTDKKREEERREGKDLENHETDKENREILDGNVGGQTARYLEQWETINMKDFIQQGFTLQWKDDLSINNLQRQFKIMKFRGTEEEAGEYKEMLEEELKENIIITLGKEQIKWYIPTFMIQKANGKWRKILDAKSLNKQIADFHFKMHDSNKVKQTIRHGDWGTSQDLISAFHHLIVQAESKPYLAFEFQNNHYTYRAMLFGTKHSPKYFATAMEPIMKQIRMKTEIKIINYVGDIFLLHQNKEYLKNMTQRVIYALKYFGFTMNMEKSETKPNQTVIFVEWEWNLANATVKTKPKKRLLLLHDLYNMRRWIKTGIETTVKQTAKLIGKLNYLRQQFQEASLFLNTMDHQKAQAARLRGWKTKIIMNKPAIPDINWLIVKLKANTPAQLIQISPKMTMTTDAAPSGWDSTLENEQEMIAMAHGTWNKRQAKLSSNNREIKAITQGLRSFAKTLKNSRVQSLAIRSDNSTAVFDIKKWRASTSLI
ncbi:MAG: putative reverse transcriptase, partial [Streblomastix strix]